MSASRDPRLRGARLAWLIVAVLAGLAVLLGLGTWQLQRMGEKQDLLDRIAQRQGETPVALAEARARVRAGEDIRFLRVRLEGSFESGTEHHLYGLRYGAPGWRVITVFDAAAGGRVLVDRGFVPVALKDSAERGGEGAGATVSFTGQVRLAETQGLFVPDNDAAANEWYWRDLGAMSDGDAAMADVLVEALEPTGPGPWPQPQPLQASAIANHHFQYALTWYGLALALLGVGWAFARSSPG